MGSSNRCEGACLLVERDVVQNGIHGARVCVACTVSVAKYVTVCPVSCVAAGRDQEEPG